MPTALLQNQMVERIENSTIWFIVVAISAATSVATTVCALGASAYCSYLRSHYRRKYLNGIASSSSGSVSSDFSETSREESIFTEDSAASASAGAGLSSQPNQEQFTFDQIYCREDEDDAEAEDNIV